MGDILSVCLLGSTVALHDLMTRSCSDPKHTHPTAISITEIHRSINCTCCTSFKMVHTPKLKKEKEKNKQSVCWSLLINFPGPNLHVHIVNIFGERTIWFFIVGTWH